MYLRFYFKGLVVVGHVIMALLHRRVSNLVTFSNSSYISNESIYMFRCSFCFFTVSVSRVHITRVLWD